MKRNLLCLLLVLSLVVCAVFAMAPMALATETETETPEPDTEETVTAHTHCECGGNLTGNGAVNHTCSEPITYEPLTADAFVDYTQQYYKDEKNDAGETVKVVATRTVKVLSSGNYYVDELVEITKDVANAGSILVAPDAEVRLCLNGKTLSTYGRSFMPNGKLTICDCVGGGKVYSGNPNSAPVMYSYSGSVVTIYGGEFDSIAPKNREYAGCMTVASDLAYQDICLADDTVVDNATSKVSVTNIYGGTFKGSDLFSTDANPLAAGRGGCFVVMHSNCTLNIYDGNFIGGDTVNQSHLGLQGGGVIYNTGYCNIYGGRFTGSKDPLGAVYTLSSGLTISGSPVFEDNAASDIYGLKNMADETKYQDVIVNIGILGENTTLKVYSEKLSFEDASQFEKIIPADNITYTLDGTTATSAITNTRIGCICGGNLSPEAIKKSGHQCADVTWQPLSLSNVYKYFKNSNSRYYQRNEELYVYLTEDVDLLYGINLNTQAKKLHIDLNGYTLAHSAGRNQLLSVSGTLTVCDSSEDWTGRMEGTRLAATEATCVYLINKPSGMTKPVFELYGGTLTGRNIISRTDTTPRIADKGSVIQLSNNSETTDYPSTFVMYGGALVAQNKSYYGGVMYIQSGSFTMYDGTISGGEVVKNASGKQGYGGNICISNNCTLNLYGGTVTGGKAPENQGGNIYITGANAALNLHGTKIENGEAVNGGNVYIDKGKLDVNGSEIAGGSATNGGNVYIYDATLTLDGAKITDGDATTSGGNMYIASGTVTLENSEITQGYAKSNGGNIYNKGTFTMESGSVTNGECGNEGGNVWTSTKTFTMNGGTISHGIAKSAGNLMTFNKVVLNKGIITEGTAKTQVGGNIRLYTGGDLTVGKDFVISNGYAKLTAGNISIAAAADKTSTVTIQGTVSGGEAGSHGGSIVVEGPGTLNVDGGTVTGGTAAKYADNIYVVGKANLIGTCTLTGKDSALYITSGANITVDDTFASEAPVVVQASAGKLAAANTDKSAMFTCPTSSVSWNEEEKALYLNGLIADNDGNTYATFGEALKAGELNTLKLLDDHEGSFENTAFMLWLNLNGKTLTGNITGSGMLYGYDTSSDDYKGPDGRITGTVECPVAPHLKGTEAIMGSVKRYMTIADETGYTFHRFYLGITHATINTTAKGVGYKAVFHADEATQAKLTGFGFNMQLDGGYVPYSVTKDMESFVSGETMTLRIDNYDVANFGTTDLTASVFLTLEDGTKIESAPITRNMKQIVEAIDAGFNTLNLSDEQKAAIKTMISDLGDAVSGWSVATITGWSAPKVEETPDETTDPSEETTPEDGTTTA